MMLIELLLISILVVDTELTKQLPLHQMHELRKRIKEINNQDPSMHLRLMQELNLSMPHSCLLIEESSSVGNDFNCHSFALNAHTDSTIVSNNRKIFTKYGTRGWGGFASLASRNLIHWISEEQINEGDIVLYLKNLKDESDQMNLNEWREINQLNVLHSGRITDNKVASKWGGGYRPNQRGGHTWMHDKVHVPSIYEDDGDSINNIYFRTSDQSGVISFLHSLI